MHIPRASLEAYQSRSQFFYSIILRSANKHLLGWESEKTQAKRFRIFVEEIPTLIPDAYASTSRPFSLLDAGCGYGALYAYLKQHKLACKYTGMDYAEECVNHARSVYGGEVAFLKANLFEPTHEVQNWGMHDVCFISGVLNLNIDTIMYAGATHEVMLFVIQKLLSISRYGVIFNVLHVKSPTKDNTFFYHDPRHISHFFKSSGIRVLRIRDEYLPNDMTLILKRNIKRGINTSTYSN